MDVHSIRSLIPSVRAVASEPGFPIGFCDVTTARIFAVDRVPGARPRCGSVKGAPHMWVKVGLINIDFTASQFSFLSPYLFTVDGYYVLVGTDQHLTSIGYDIHADSTCEQQFTMASNLALYGEFGKPDGLPYGPVK